MKQQWACIRSPSNYESETSFIIERAGRVRPFPTTSHDSYFASLFARIVFFLLICKVFFDHGSRDDILRRLNARYSVSIVF